MQHREFVFLLASAALAAVGPAQQTTRPEGGAFGLRHAKSEPAPRAPRPVPLAPPGARGGLPALAGSSFDPAVVRFDAPSPGELWAATGSYKVRFTARDVTFIPFLGSEAPRNWPVTLRVDRVLAGGAVLDATAAAAPVARGTTVDIDRGAFVERWHLRAAEVEQTFVFESRPAAGELTIEVDVDTELTLREAGNGTIELRGPDGGVRHGTATGFDAAGRSAELVTTVRGRTLVHRLDRGFVASADLPLVVDPVISTLGGSQYTRDCGGPDAAFEAGSGLWALVHEVEYSLTDTDVLIELFDDQGRPVPGTRDWVDVTTDDWRAPRIAANRAAGRFLVVAERRAASGSEWRIHGRIHRAAGGGMLLPFAVSSPSPPISARRPDVGGDGSTSGSGVWAVVYEYENAPGNHHVFGATVRGDGTIARSLINVDSSSRDDRNPRISKTNGLAGAGVHEWMVVFQRTYSPNDRDVYGTILGRDGSVSTTTFPIETSSLDEIWPAVSSPTLPIGGQRYFLVVAQREVGAGDHDIVCALLEGSRVVRKDNLSALEGPSHSGLQVRPAVDSDGCRFAVAYSETLNSSTNDYDVYASTVHLLLGTSVSLGLTESRAWIGSNPYWEGSAAVAAAHDGDGAHYLVSYEDSNGTQPALVRGALYEGAGAGGLTRLLHGCHGLSITATGEPKLGERVTVDVPGPPNGVTTSGTLFGLLRSRPLPVPLCSVPCELGVDGPAYPARLHIDIPCDGALVGAQVAVQGWDRLGGSCVGSGLRLSDTIVITVR